MAGQDRPSPRKLSDLFMQGDDGLPSVKNRTALFAFFGENANDNGSGTRCSLTGQYFIYSAAQQISSPLYQLNHHRR